MTFTFALMLAWVVVHTVMSAGATYLATTRRGGREFFMYAVLCFALALYCTGSAMLAVCNSVRDSAFAQGLQLTGAWCGFAAAIPFCSAVVGVPAPKLERAGYVVSLVGVILVAGGMYIDISTPTTGAPLLPVTPPPYQAATHRFMLLDRIPCFILLVLAARHSALLVQALGRGIVFTTTLIIATGWSLEFLERFLQRPTSFASEHCGAVASVLLGYAVTRRFADGERELDGRNRELRRAYDELRQMQSEIVRKEQLAAVGELSAVIAHEIRNPLAILKTAVAGLRKDALEEDGRDVLLGVLDEETDRLNRLVRDLLAYARPVELQTRKVDLAELIRTTFSQAMRGRRRIEPIDLVVDVAEDAVHIVADQSLLERAFGNVLENAVEAMPNGGIVRVSAGEAERNGRAHRTLSFSDTGEGMDTLVRERATTPLFTTRVSGTGLGLAIVERVMAAHEGYVDIASRPEGGTVVTLALPLVLSRAADESQA